jgi:hypothetical protein
MTGTRVFFRRVEPKPHNRECDDNGQNYQAVLSPISEIGCVTKTGFSRLFCARCQNLVGVDKAGSEQVVCVRSQKQVVGLNKVGLIRSLCA